VQAYLNIELDSHRKTAGAAADGGHVFAKSFGKEGSETHGGPTVQDYLNIELDSHRNQLIQLELLLTAGMFAMALMTLIAGLFGMNLNNTHEESYSAFIIVRPPSSSYFPLSI